MGTIWRMMRLAVVLSVALLGCSRQQPTADADVARRVADTFLSQIRTGQIKSAWESTSAEFKSDEGLESFTAYVRSKPVLLQAVSFASYEVTELNGLKLGQCLYDAAGDSKAALTKVRLVIGQEAGEWKVEGIFVD